MRRNQNMRDAKSAVMRRRGVLSCLSQYFTSGKEYGNWYWIKSFFLLFVVLFLIPKGVFVIIKMLDKALKLGIF